MLAPGPEVQCDASYPQRSLSTVSDMCLLALGFLFWWFVGAWSLSQAGVNALRGPLEKGLLSVPGPRGEDVAGISWESLRMQTEVGRVWRRPRTQSRGVVGGQPSGSGLRGHTGSGGGWELLEPKWRPCSLSGPP